MSKVVIEIVDCGTKYVCKLAKSFFGGDSGKWSLSKSASLAWRFDSLEEAEQIWKSEYPVYAPHEGDIYARPTPTFFEVNT